MRPALFLILIALCPQLAAEPERWFPEALGQDGRITLSPGFSPDGNFAVLTQSECGRIERCPQRMKTIARDGSGWSKPELVARTANGRVDWPSVAPDGTTLLFSWAVPRDRHEGQSVYEDFDLYSLSLLDSDAEPIPLDEPDINRIRGGKLSTLRYFNNETAPVLTESGDLYFWTEREDGIGERDIYIATANPDGNFQRPTALPAPINTTGRDDHVWVTPDASLMLLSRRVNGRSDLFVSRRGSGGRWVEPENLGPTVNSDGDDFAARITPDGETLVFTSDRAFDDTPAGLLQVWAVPVSSVPALMKPN
ncbi:MAG: hypothetical protein AAGL69_04935 [Pseudomonadota bacterium]